MDLRKSFNRLSKIAILSLLILLTPILSTTYGSPLVSADEDQQGNFLSGFNLVPGSVTLVEEHYILALFKNAEDDLYAVVLFGLNCASDTCDVGEVVAYALFDSEGVEKQLVKGSQVENPQAPEHHVSDRATGSSDWTARLIIASSHWLTKEERKKEITYS